MGEKLDTIVKARDTGDLGNPGGNALLVGGHVPGERIGIDGGPAVAEGRQQHAPLQDEILGVGRL